MSADWSRVLVVAWSDEVARTCRDALQADGCVVVHERAGLAADATARRFRPHLVVLEPWYPDGTDGIALGRRLRVANDVALLFLAHGVEQLFRAYEAGADDFMVQPIHPGELVVRTRAVLRRTGCGTSAVWQVGELVVDEGAHQVLLGDEQIELTPIEFGILARLVRTPGRVVSKAQLFDDVWQSEVFDLNVVEVHVSLLRRKLEEVGPRIVHTVRGVGYVVRAPAPAPAVALGPR